MNRSRRVSRQRNRAAFQMAFAVFRAFLWLVLIVMYLAGVHFTDGLFRSVAFVAVISLYANAATDAGAAIAAYAAVTAADARHDVSESRDDLAKRILAVVEAEEDRHTY